MIRRRPTDSRFLIALAITILVITGAIVLVGALFGELVAASVGIAMAAVAPRIFEAIEQIAPDYRTLRAAATPLPERWEDIAAILIIYATLLPLDIIGIGIRLGGWGETICREALGPVIVVTLLIEISAFSFTGYTVGRVFPKRAETLVGIGLVFLAVATIGESWTRADQIATAINECFGDDEFLDSSDEGALFIGTSVGFVLRALFSLYFSRMGAKHATKQVDPQL